MDAQLVSARPAHRHASPASLVAALLLAGALVTPAQAAPAGEAVQVPLNAYKLHLRSVEVIVAGVTRTFLVDTGGGVTVISPAVAKEAGCTPAGRLVAFRLSGERIEAPLCRDVELRVGAQTLTPPEAVVMDLAALMPPDWPRLDGLLALHSFQGLGLTLDAAQGHLIIESGAALRGRMAEVKPVNARFGRQAGGSTLDAFVAVTTAKGPAWVEVDTGAQGTLLSRHTVEALGLKIPAGADAKPAKPVALPKALLEVQGFGTLDGPARLQESIYDGVVGFDRLGTLRLSFDLERYTMWMERTGKR